jgi:hypothetical protein
MPQIASFAVNVRVRSAQVSVPNTIGLSAMFGAMFAQIGLTVTGTSLPEILCQYSRDYKKNSGENTLRFATYH